MYVDNNELNALDQFYKGRARYLVTPSFGLGADISFLSDYRPTRDIEETGLLLSPLRRNRVTANLSADRQITEKNNGIAFLYVFG